MHINLLPYLINYLIKTPTMLNRSCKCRVLNVKNGNTVGSCETPGINKKRRFEPEFQHSQYTFPWKQTTHRTSRFFLLLHNDAVCCTDYLPSNKDKGDVALEEGLLVSSESSHFSIVSTRTQLKLRGYSYIHSIMTFDRSL